MSQRVGPMNSHGPKVAHPHQHQQQQQQQQNYIKVLEEYFSRMGLGAPEFKTSKISGKASKKGSNSVKFYATVRVNNLSYQVTHHVYPILCCSGPALGKGGSLLVA